MQLQHLTRTQRRAPWRTAYRETALGPDVVEYLRHKTKRLTAKSYRGYERTLALFALEFPDLALLAFEPPAGTRLIEDFLADHWSHRNPKTYNIQLSTLKDFFKWAALRERIKGDPTLPIERGKGRPFHRTTFTAAQCEAILDATRNIRYRLAVRLMLDYGLRKGALANVQLEHFDHHRERLTIFTKGEKIHVVPIPDPGFWAELAELEAEPGCEPHHYLLCKHRVRRTRTHGAKLLSTMADHLAAIAATTVKVEAIGAEGAIPLVREKVEELADLIARPGLIGERMFGWDPEKQLGEHGIHTWWYRRLACAGIVAPGTNRGKRLHTARHTAAQRLLEASGGDIVSVQHLLGHANVATTQTYVGHDPDQLYETLKKALVK